MQERTESRLPYGEQAAPGILMFMRRSSSSSAVYIAAAIAAAGLLYARRSKESRLRAGQVAVITGGSRGLGLALAHRFGKAGLKLILAARDEEELGTARRELLKNW